MDGQHVATGSGSQWMKIKRRAGPRVHMLQACVRSLSTCDLAKSLLWAGNVALYTIPLSP